MGLDTKNQDSTGMAVGELKHHESFNEPATRRDRFGTRICPEVNKHRVSFADEVGEGSLRTVHLVESYKQYNVDTSAHLNCTCSVL